MTISDPLATRLDGVVTTLCHAWRLTRADGTVMGFTDHDMPLVIGGHDFEPQSGMTASEARDSAGLAVDATEIAGALSSGRITEADIVAGFYDGAIVETLLVDWTDPSAHAVIRVATVGRINRADHAFTAELEGFGRGLDQPRGRYFRRGCDAEVGDAQCGVDLASTALRGTGIVQGTDPMGVVVFDGLSQFAEGWFTGGEAIWPSGARRRIVNHRRVGNQAFLTFSPGGSDPVAGQVITVTAGCDKSFATCRRKFANQANFRGFPHLPGNDAAYAYATEDAVFDGAPLVP